jgi:hypothetical protein
MLKRSRLFAALVMVSFMSVTFAGINWKAVWLNTPDNPVHLKMGESSSYTVMGLDGRDTKADLTHSQYLTVVSSDQTILEVDKQNARFIGKAPGHVEIRISFSEATSILKANVVDASRQLNDSKDGPSLSDWQIRVVQRNSGCINGSVSHIQTNDPNVLIFH